MSITFSIGEIIFMAIIFLGGAFLYFGLFPKKWSVAPGIGLLLLGSFGLGWFTDNPEGFMQGPVSVGGAVIALVIGFIIAFILDISMILPRHIFINEEVAARRRAQKRKKARKEAAKRKRNKAPHFINVNYDKEKERKKAERYKSISIITFDDEKDDENAKNDNNK